jgi:hypothetical protein
VFVLLALAGTPILAIVLYAVLAVLMPVRPTLLDFHRTGRTWRYR